MVIIALNEESNIERCLKSVQWADEVLVYDSGSKDGTIRIAQKLGANAVSGPWLGFGPTKNQAALLAKHDWIFSIDADEEVTEELALELMQQQTKEQSNLPLNIQLDPATAYRIPRLSWYLNQWVRHGGWYPDYQTRLFNRTHCNWNESMIHEKVETNNYVNLSNHLNHYVFKNIDQHMQTNNKYSSLIAKDLFKSGKRFSWFHFLTKPTVKFFECYFLKHGYLDGWVGYFIAKGAAYSVFLKWSKLKELEMNEK